MGVGGQHHAPHRFTPEIETRYPLNTGWVGPGPVRTGPKISPPPGFDPQAVQPIASRYTDGAVPATICSSSSSK